MKLSPMTVSHQMERARTNKFLYVESLWYPIKMLAGVGLTSDRIATLSVGLSKIHSDDRPLFLILFMTGMPHCKLAK